jgi:Tol biopolymer transport system component
LDSSTAKFVHTGLLLGLLSCGGDPSAPPDDPSVPTGPTKGAISVTAVTSGADLDPNGYSVSVDGRTPSAVPSHGTATIEGVEIGEHTLTLAGIDENCVLAESMPIRVTVVAGSAATVNLHITCTYANTLAYSEGTTVYITSANPGAVPRVIAEGYRSPVWSPDGSALAVHTDDGIYLLDPDGTNPRLLHSFAVAGKVIRFGIAQWSPDGEAILVYYTESSSLTAPWALYRVSVHGDDDGFFVTDVGPDQCRAGLQPSWSPDSRHVVLRGSSALCIFSAEGTPESSIEDGGFTLVRERPDWHPDGSRIAFTHFTYEGLGAAYRAYYSIRTILPGGTGEVNLSAPHEGDQEPHWSPDGRKLAFLAIPSTGGDPDLYVMNADGSNRRQLASIGGKLSIKWSRDGTRIAFIKGWGYDAGDGLNVVRLDGSEPTHISSAAYSYDWRP